MLKIRCSQIGKIMPNSRTKGELSKTCKSYLEALAIENMYGYSKDIWSKAIDKGIAVEDQSIQLAQEVLDMGEMTKNEEFFENEYLTGTPDVLNEDFVLDVKSSLDATTFPWFDKDVPNKDYMYQLMAYMALTGRKISYLAYCLVDTPEDIVEDEVRRVHYKFKEIDENPIVRATVERQHSFERVPAKYRVKTFKIEYDQEVVDKIYQRVEECREYYESLLHEQFKTVAV
tara:strand:+ start:21 stop:710 length:690 start_codon:yes stop_codon:yes gene_type:complete